MNLPSPLSGNSPLVSWLNRLLRACRSNQLMPGVGYKLRQTPQGTVLQIAESAPGNSTPVTIQQFKIQWDGGDWWICKSWDGSSLGSSLVNIIKPYKLRCLSYRITSEVIRGVTYTYTYTPSYITGSSGPVSYYTRAVSGSDGSSETDYCIPDPVANDIIYAVECSTNVFSAMPITIGAASIVNSGSSYAANDILTVSGGTGTAATIKVLTVSSGHIATAQVYTAGNYSAAPSLSANAVTGGAGTGATFDLTLATNLIDLNTDGRAWSK